MITLEDRWAVADALLAAWREFDGDYKQVSRWTRELEVNDGRGYSPRQIESMTKAAMKYEFVAAEARPSLAEAMAEPQARPTPKRMLSRDS